jgi:hypothetical protein
MKVGKVRIQFWKSTCNLRFEKKVLLKFKWIKFCPWLEKLSCTGNFNECVSKNWISHVWTEIWIFDLSITDCSKYKMYCNLKIEIISFRKT